MHGMSYFSCKNSKPDSFVKVLAADHYKEQVNKQCTIVFYLYLYIRMPNPCCVIVVTKGKQKQEKISGPNTDPCGTPEINFISSALLAYSKSFNQHYFHNFKSCIQRCNMLLHSTGKIVTATEQQKSTSLFNVAVLVRLWPKSLRLHLVNFS